MLNKNMRRVCLLIVSAVVFVTSLQAGQAGQTVTVRNVTLGEGRPKICSPITSATTAELLDEIAMVRQSKADIVEWRVDFFGDVFDLQKVKIAACQLRNAMGDTPLLFTFRTKQEGGEKEIAKDYYVALNQGVAESGFVDLVDFEMFTGDDACRAVIDAAHAAGVKVVLSSHDFKKTPAQNVIEDRLLKMAALGADLPKIAVMARTPEDVLTLLAATVSVSKQLEDRCPIITMSMSSLGTVSRMCGEAFGSSLSFGTVKRASAPGQLTTGDLSAALDMLRLAK